MDAYVFYFQSKVSFPSWTSRVRSPSPALSFSRAYNLRPKGLPRFCRVHSQEPIPEFQLPGVESPRRLRVDVQVNLHIMAHQISHRLWIDPEFAHQGRERPTHHLRINPSESNRFAVA